MKKQIELKPTNFDYVNQDAIVVIVGITPGNSQLSDGEKSSSSKDIKKEYAFGGNMRPNLVSMLNHIGVNTLLGIKDCSSLWGDDFDLVEMTSLIKNAAYIDGKMFNKVTDIPKYEELQKAFEEGFVSDCKSYGKAKLFVGLGRGVYDKLIELKNNGTIKAEVVGITHPSGANGGRIANYLGKSMPKDKAGEWCTERANEAKTIINQLQ